jgi:hypothetical protein
MTDDMIKRVARAICHSDTHSEIQVSYDLAREDKELTTVSIVRVFENGFKVLCHLQGGDAEAFVDAWNNRISACADTPPEKDK